MTDDHADDERLADVASKAAIVQLVSSVVSLAVMVGVSVAITRRDALARAWLRLRHRPLTPDQARAEREVAGLYRDLSKIEHGDHAPPRPPRGLYEDRAV